MRPLLLVRILPVLLVLVLAQVFRGLLVFQLVVHPVVHFVPLVLLCRAVSACLGLGVVVSGVVGDQLLVPVLLVARMRMW